MKRLIGLALIALLAGCGKGPSNGALLQLTKDQNIDYSHKTCRDFRHNLTEQQRGLVAAEGLRAGLRADALPTSLTDDQVALFERDIDIECGIAGGGQPLVPAVVAAYQEYP